MFRIIFCFVLLCLPSAIFANRFVPDGYCVIVLASKPTAEQAISDARIRWSDHDVTIYRSKNGWYAITGATLLKSRQEQVIRRLKAQGALPRDAFCSTGASYVERTRVIAAAQPNQDQGKQSLFSPFLSARLSYAEKRFLQLALAFEGDYQGLVDGAWGKISDRALRAYTWREFETAPQEWHTAMLAFKLVDELKRDNWGYHYNEWLKMSYIFPYGAYKEGTPSENFANFEHTRSSLNLSFARGTLARTQRLHTYVGNQHAGRDDVYEVRKPNYAVTAARLSDGSYLYIRSHQLDGLWSTVMASASRWDDKIFRAFTASIAIGKASGLDIESNGHLARNIKSAIALLEEKPASKKTQPDVASVGVAPKTLQPRAETKLGTGSGFVVSQAGHILTNEHVVNGCSRLRVAGNDVRLLEVNEAFDLALLQGDPVANDMVARFAINPAPLNSDLTVLGYPLEGLLGGLNVTRGTLSSLKGLKGDATQMQISAPIQPGNSGGPVVDETGAVIGVVVAKLKAGRRADGSLDLRQNVNFAIRAEIAKLFLVQSGVTPASALTTTALKPVELAAHAAKFTRLVECYE